MGDSLDETKAQHFTAGGYAVAPAHMNHFAWTKTGPTIQVNSMGPFEMALREFGGGSVCSAAKVARQGTPDLPAFQTTARQNSAKALDLRAAFRHRMRLVGL